MSRRAIQIGEEDITALIVQVQLNFGGPIKTKKNILDLIDQIIKQNQKDLISLNTLRRFFKLIPSNHTPTIETLNILSRYCGYSSWDEFTYVSNQNSENFLGHSMIQILRNQWSRDQAEKLIVDYAKSEKLYFWLASVFSNLSEKDKVFIINLSLDPVTSPQHENTALGYAQYFWVQTIGCYLMQLEEEKLLSVLNKIQHLKIVVELCVNYNASDKNYDLLLHHTQSLFASNQDLTFFRSIQWFRFFLKNKKWSPPILSSIHSTNITPDQLDIKPFSRMRALHILSHHPTFCAYSTIQQDIHFFRKNKSYRESIVFYIIEICRALCYVKKDAEAIQILEDYNRLYQGNIGFWASIHRNSLQLYASWAFALNNQKEKAKEYYHQFNPSLVENFQEECIRKDHMNVKKLLNT
jgi:hypothetical protein